MVHLIKRLGVWNFFNTHVSYLLCRIITKSDTGYLLENSIMTGEHLIKVLKKKQIILNSLNIKLIDQWQKFHPFKKFSLLSSSSA